MSPKATQAPLPLDPPISAAAEAAHDAALARGEQGYLDPRTGLFVMTSLALGAKGRCCGSGCRHCPYPADEQRRSGRPRLRAHTAR